MKEAEDLRKLGGRNQQAQVIIKKQAEDLRALAPRQQKPVQGKQLCPICKLPIPPGSQRAHIKETFIKEGGRPGEMVEVHSHCADDLLRKKGQRHGNPNQKKFIG